MPVDMSKYLGLFVQESTEHLEGFGRDLVQLERQGRSAEVVDSMFRHAHSVKGMAASMGFSGVAALAHRAEDLVDRVRRRPEILSAEVVDLLLEAGDRLLELVKLAAAGAELPPPGTIVDRMAASVRAADGLPPVAPTGDLPWADVDPAATPSAPATSAAPGGPAVPAASAPAPSAPAPAPSPADLPGGATLLVQVRIAETCPTPGVRAFLVHKKLSALGAIAKVTPSIEDCKAGRIPDGKLTLVLDGVPSAEAVKKALAQVADLASVEIAEPPKPEPPKPEPAAAAMAPSPIRQVDSKVASTVRVRTEILDYFLDSVGELILATSRLREIGRTLPERHRPALEEGVDALHRIVKDLHGKVMSVRMTPMALLTDRLPRVARDLARQVGREVEVDVSGTEIELDRAILEVLGDPITHVIRNCVDHGIEMPDERKAAGKPSRGRITIRGRRDRDRVILEIEDDGRGMDAGKLRRAAVDRGLLTVEVARAMSDREAFLLACLPGVSTAQVVTDLSGRGVGMDAVKRTVESLGGTVEIESVLGRGTRFSLRLPLTVAVVNLLLVGVSDEIFGLPITKVIGAVEAIPKALERSVGASLLPYDDEFVPVHRLRRLLALPASAAGFDAGPRPHVVVEGDTGRVALEVDRLVGQEEAVLKPLGAPLDLVPGLAGITILGTGRPVFILDVPRLLSA